MSEILGRDFSSLWGAQAVSIIGSEISAVAVPLFAINVLGLDSQKLGTLLALQGAPQVIFGIFAGVWVDRVSRRRVLLLSDIVRFILVFMVPALYITESLTTGMLFTFVFMISTITVFSDTAYWSYVPTVIPAEKLLIANARLSLTQSVATTAGPGVAGLITSSVGAPYALILDSFSYLVSFLLIKRVNPPQTEQRDVSQEPMIKSLILGLRFVFGNFALVLLATGAAIWHLVYFAVLAILYIHLAKVLHSPPYLIGILLSCGGIGSLFGAGVISRVKLKEQSYAVLGATLVLAQVGLLPVSLATNSTLLSQCFVGVGLFLSCAMATIHSIFHITLRQEATPEEYLGRMTSVVRLISWGAIPLGSLLGGYLLNLTSSIKSLEIVSLIGAGLTTIWLIGYFACFRTKLVPSISIEQGRE